METTTTRWTAGDRVVVRGTDCTITHAQKFADCEGLRLAPHSPPDTHFATLLVPFDRPRRMDANPRPHAVRPRRWLHALRRAGMHHQPFGSLRCAARSSIELLPYQMEPALAVLRHASLRVLLADAVGLGKTIQAGLVLAEVLDDAPSGRALVVMPAGLRHQWQSELLRHFSLEAPICDAAWLRQRARELPADTNPWSLPGAYLVSIDFIKRPEVLSAVEALLWDIVIVDEAHVVTSGTDRRAAVDAVAARGRRVLLLTGTPHSGDEAEFDALCRLGEGPARTPLAVFRRSRRDVGGTVPRRSVLLRIRLSAPERRMHELLERYASRLWRESLARGDHQAALVAIVLRKRALSSAGSLAASVSRRIALLSPGSARETLQLSLPLHDADEELDDRVRDDVLGTPGLSNPATERRWLGTLLESARAAARNESKIARLRRFLARISEPAIVFTEYRDTLARLHRVVENCGPPVLVLHGGLSASERRIVQHAFNDRPALLLATDAAAEGLNLQRHCRLVIHFELPWNPLRLEQRTGRVDRIGQTRRVHEIALVAADTAERMVLAPLARRAGRAREVAPSGGRMLELLSEARVADAVMAGSADSLANVPALDIPAPSPQLAREAAREVARLAEQRRWLRSGPTSKRDMRPVVTSLSTRRRCDPPGAILVYLLSCVTTDGKVVHREPLALHLTFAGRAHPAHSAAGALARLEEFLKAAEPRVNMLIAERFRALASDVYPRYRALLASLRARELAIAAVPQSAARQLVQAGLFDRRAVREAEKRHAARDERSKEADERLKAFASAESVTDAVYLAAALIRQDPKP